MQKDPMEETAAFLDLYPPEVVAGVVHEMQSNRELMVAQVAVQGLLLLEAPPAGPVYWDKDFVVAVPLLELAPQPAAAEALLKWGPAVLEAASEATEVMASLLHFPELH
jgi:hypothetical protein